MEMDFCVVFCDSSFINCLLFAHKNKKIWIATVNYQRLFKELQRILTGKIVTGKNVNKSKFKPSGQTGKQR
jgi:hypothetical protein